jgi:hypothetical protein
MKSSEWLFETRDTNNADGNYEGLVHQEQPGGFNWEQ